MLDASRWDRFVDVVAVVWLGLFLVLVAGWFGIGSPGPTVEWALRALLVVFLADVLVLYRRVEGGPAAFVRSNWLDVLTVVPWFRPLRLARIGRGLRALKGLARSRRAGAALNKLRRLGIRLWPGRDPD